MLANLRREFVTVCDDAAISGFRDTLNSTRPKTTLPERKINATDADDGWWQCNQARQQREAM